jgi:hypothetical protein
VYIKKYPPPLLYIILNPFGGKICKVEEKKEENVKEKGEKTKYYGKNEVKRVHEALILVNHTRGKYNFGRRGRG